MKTRRIEFINAIFEDKIDIHLVLIALKIWGSCHYSD